MDSQHIPPVPQPRAIYKHLITLTGVPIEVTVSAVGDLLTVYGITHSLPTGTDSSAIGTGNEQIDATNNTRYFALRTLLDGISLDYYRTECTAQVLGSSVNLTLTCY